MERMILPILLFMIVIGGVNNCSEHQERRTAAIEKTAENTTSHSYDDSYDSKREYDCAIFLGKPYADELVTQALIARSFIDPMSTAEIARYSADSLQMKVRDYQIQWLKYDSIDAQGRIDCLTIEELGLLQMREITNGELIQRN
jgi:hypothetical protein